MRLALSPNYPAVYLPTLGNAYRTCGATEEAIAASKAYHARSRTSELHRRYGPTLKSSAVMPHESRPMSPRFAPPAFRWVEACVARRMICWQSAMRFRGKEHEAAP